MYLDVNGQRYQDVSTPTMHFSVAMIASHPSQFMSLQPCDVFSTGTPPGVGMGRNLSKRLKPGERTELAIQGLCVQTQNALASP